jgi:hypothetical protein
MGQINVEKDVKGIKGLCVITPLYMVIIGDISWKHIASGIWKKKELI